MIAEPDLASSIASTPNFPLSSGLWSTVLANSSQVATYLFHSEKADTQDPGTLLHVIPVPCYGKVIRMAEELAALKSKLVKSGW